MAEHGEAPEVELEEAGLEPPSPAALELALQGQGTGSFSGSPEAAEFLRKQTHMLDVQMEHLHEQRELNLNHLRWRRFSDQVKGGLQLLSLLAGGAVVAAVLAMAWSAHRDHGLVIDAFSVPPDLAKRGVTGPVVAAHVLDRLSALQEETDSGRAPDTFRNHGEDEVKLEIPETGVSIGELQQALVHWLGHRTHITGELYETPAGLALTARAGEGPGSSFVDPKGDEAALVEKAAEAIFHGAQPYRYGVYLWQHGRDAEAQAAFRELALHGPIEDQAWAHFGWGGVLGAAGDLDGQADQARAGLEIGPKLAAGWQTLAVAEEALGHTEAARAAYARQLAAAGFGLAPRAAAQNRLLAHAKLKELQADYLGAARAWAPSRKLADYQSMGSEADSQTAVDQAWAHDTSRVAAAMEAVSPDESAPLLLARLEIARAYALDDWTGVAARLEALYPKLAAAPHARRLEHDWTSGIAPWLAYAQQRTGHPELAARTLTGLPPDCQPCLVMRGAVAAEAGDYATAEAVLRQAIDLAPSDPWARFRLGEALAKRGDVAGAERAFTAASQKAPRWAEPKLALAESLLRRGQTADGLARLREAAILAPRWTRPRQVLALATRPQK